MYISQRIFSAYRPTEGYSKRFAPAAYMDKWPLFPLFLCCVCLLQLVVLNGVLASPPPPMAIGCTVVLRRRCPYHHRRYAKQKRLAQAYPLLSHATNNILPWRAEQFRVLALFRTLALKSVYYLRPVFSSVLVKHLGFHWIGRIFVKFYFRNLYENS